MAEGLSQQQIDELLGNIQSGELDINQIEPETDKKIKEYDFRSPKRISKDQLKFLGNIYDNFARFLNLQLSSLLRVGSSIEILDVEEQEYKEYNNALNDSVLIGIFNVKSNFIKDDMNQIIIEIDRSLSFSMLDLLLGGDGSGYNIKREYTDIELKIFEYFFNMAKGQLNNSWANYIELDHEFSMIETNSRIVQFLKPIESIALVTLKMSIKEVEGNINICVPSALIETIYSNLNGGTMKKRDDTRNEQYRELLFNSINKSTLSIKGILGETNVSLQELLQLQVGDILILNDKKKDDSTKVTVEDEYWFDADVGINKKNYALKLKSKV